MAVRVLGRTDCGRRLIRVCVCVRTWLLAESVQKRACVHVHACSGVACECRQINDKDSVAARNRFHK